MKKYTTESYKEIATKIHKGKYDYSNVIYKNSSTKIRIICPRHGEFEQYPLDHLKGHGCSKCANNVPTNEEFIKMMKVIHGDKYDYAKTNFNGYRKEIIVTCPIHGDFKQKAIYHSQGCGCPECGRESTTDKKRITLDYFLKESKIKHGGFYNYDKIKEIHHSRQKVVITCPIHGDFEQEVESHLRGYGCKKCSLKKTKLEDNIKKLLEENKINFQQQKQFVWLGKQSLDFYLPDFSIAIECQGEQHYRPINFYGGEETFKKIKERDSRKLKLCQENGIRVIYYTNLKKYSDKINILNLDEVKEKILSTPLEGN